MTRYHYKSIEKLNKGKNLIIPDAYENTKQLKLLDIAGGNTEQYSYFRK